MKFKLSEAGKVQAKRNIERLKAMKTAVEAMLAEIGDGEAEAKESAIREAWGLVEGILRQSDSLDGRRQLVQAAVRDKLRDPMQPNQYVYVYIRDMFPDTAVYTAEDGDLFQVAYNIDNTSGSPVVTLGEPVEVQIAYVPVDDGDEVQESASFEVAFVPLVEKAVRTDGTVPLKLIDAGWGSSGYYSKDVLKRDIPKVFPAGTKMFWNHQTAQEAAQRPEGDLDDLAAVLTSAPTWQDAGPDGPGIYADAKVFEAYQGPVNDLAEHIGVSIRAGGRAALGEAEGRKGPIVQEISVGKSVDFVTDPGRGGKILQLFEAARPKRGAPAPQPSNEENTTMLLTESQQQQLLDDNKTLQESVSTLSTQLARLNEAMVLTQARTFVEAHLPPTLPALTRARLVESLAGKPVLKDGALDAEGYKAAITEAAKAEVDYLAKVTGSGRITGMGETLRESAGAEAPKPEDVEKTLAESFKVLGLSESAAAIAAKGR